MRYLLTFVAILCFFLAQTAAAQDFNEPQLSSSEEQRAARINEAVLSPFCPGQTLATCPSPNAKMWREDIKRWVKEGVPSKEIASRLQARIPEKNLSGLPPNRWDWLLPVFGLGLASLLLFFIIRKLRVASLSSKMNAPAENNNTPKSQEPSTDEFDTRLDAELKELS